MIEIFDGAMGTQLQANGLKLGACPELMNVENPDVVRKIHRAYIDAGSTIVTTNTFGASRLKLEHYGLSERVRELNSAAVKIAKSAGNVKVAGDIGPTGKFIYPLGDLDFDEAYRNFFEQCQALAEAGADFLIFETFIDLQEMRAGLLAAKDACNLPVICQMSYSEDQRTVTGTDPATAAICLESLGASIIGVNCSLGPEQLIPIVKKISDACKIPVSVEPNAGMPFLDSNGETRFPMNAETFGSFARALVESGATYLGGCCGTTPEHIRALKKNLAGLDEIQTRINSERLARTRKLTLTSRTKSVTIDKNLPTRLIGERINPTGRKKLAAEIRDGSFLSVKKEAINQVKAGADILDVNMGVAGIDQTSAMKRAIVEISQITDAPLAIDTSDADSLEIALKYYPGRALINSVSAEKIRLEKFLPLAKRYGAAILCLPLTDEGVPTTARDRVDVEKVILNEAKKIGLSDGDFLLDSLVMTVSADSRACNEVLETLQLYRKEIDQPTTMGLSNISFGLPNRPLINSTFFAMALAFGLNAPIMNPYDDSMKNILQASAALLGIDQNGIAFSKNFSGVQSKVATAKISELNPIDAIKQAVIDGEKDEINSLIDRAVAENFSANEITERSLTAAMNEIGVDFGTGKIFLPQVLLSAETMRTAFEYLKEKFPSQESRTLGTVIMATVKGDVHDLGKNITGALLANSGFNVIDLGKDVDSKTIVDSAIEHNADIVGLCALMTTTMIQIDKVVEDLHSAGSRAKIMVGGAAVTQEYADKAGADAYAKDGVQAVEIAKRFVGIFN